MLIDLTSVTMVSHERCFLLRYRQAWTFNIKGAADAQIGAPYCPVGDLRYGAMLGGKPSTVLVRKYDWCTLIRTTGPSKPLTGVSSTSFSHTSCRRVYDMQNWGSLG